MKFLRNFLDSIEHHFIDDGKLHKFYSVYEMVDTFLYTPSDTTKSGPHVRDAIDLKRSMVIVVLALLPSFFFGTYNVAYQELLNINNGNLEGITLNHINLFLTGLQTVLPIYIVVFTAGGLCELTFALIRGHEIINPNYQDFSEASLSRFKMLLINMLAISTDKQRNVMIGKLRSYAEEFNTISK